MFWKPMFWNYILENDYKLIIITVIVFAKKYL